MDMTCAIPMFSYRQVKNDEPHLFTFGHVRQLDAVAARLLGRLAAAAPVLPGADQVAFVDIPARSGVR